MTQEPLEDTAFDFWGMIYDYKCSALVYVQCGGDHDVVMPCYGIKVMGNHLAKWCIILVRVCEAMDNICFFHGKK